MSSFFYKEQSIEDLDRNIKHLSDLVRLLEDNYTMQNPVIGRIKEELKQLKENRILFELARGTWEE